MFSWRILWLANLPTGLALIILGTLIPESARFLVAHGRIAEAHAAMRRFGGGLNAVATSQAPVGAVSPASTWTMVALSAAALSWGLINFGLLLWLPSYLIDKGYPVGVSSALLARSALIALPTVIAVAALYSRWSGKWSLAMALSVTLLGLMSVFRLGSAYEGNPIWPIALLIIGTNSLIAILLPYTAENFALAVRGRATGWVAACTKAGGVGCQLSAILGMVPSVTEFSAMLAIPTVIALGLTVAFREEPRRRNLREVDLRIT